MKRNEFDPAFGCGLRMLMARDMVTTDVLSARTGVTQKTIYYIRAERTAPRDDTERLLAEAFGMTPEEVKRIGRKAKAAETET